MTFDTTNSVQSLDIVRERLKELKRINSYTWREIACMPEFYGLPAGTLASIAKGREPKDPHTREKLNLPVLVPTPACTVCGKVHIKPSCPTQRKPRIPKAASPLEASMSFLLRAGEFPEPETEYKFHPTRKWRFDFAWPGKMIAVEVEGGTHSNGRHNRHAGYTNDCEKYNEAALLGWKVYRFTGEMIHDGRAYQTLAAALELPADKGVFRSMGLEVR